MNIIWNIVSVPGMVGIGHSEPKYCLPNGFRICYGDSIIRAIYNIRAVGWDTHIKPDNVDHRKYCAFPPLEQISEHYK